jgi:hypothetical protein
MIDAAAVDEEDDVDTAEKVHPIEIGDAASPQQTPSSKRLTEHSSSQQNQASNSLASSPPKVPSLSALSPLIFFNRVWV